MRRRQVHLTRTGPLRPDRCGHPPGFDTRCFPTIDLHSRDYLTVPSMVPPGPVSALPHAQGGPAAPPSRLLGSRHKANSSLCWLKRRTLKAQVCPAGCFAALFGVLTHSHSARQALLRTKEPRAGPRYVLRLPSRRNHPQSLQVFPSGSTAGHPPGHTYSQLRAGAAHPKGCSLLFIDPMTIASLSQQSWNKQLVMRTRYLSRRLNPPRAVPPNAVPQRQTRCSSAFAAGITHPTAQGRHTAGRLTGHPQGCLPC